MLFLPALHISIQALYDYKNATIEILGKSKSFQFKHCTIISHNCKQYEVDSTFISIQALYDYKLLIMQNIYISFIISIQALYDYKM